MTYLYDEEHTLSPDRRGLMPEIGSPPPHLFCEVVTTAERRSGPPILSAKPLSAKERQALADLGRALRIAADRCDEALATGRADRGLEACTLAGDIGIAAARAGAVIGGGRS